MLLVTPWVEKLLGVCLKYIPHRLAGASLVTPVVNYWWSSLPANLTREAYYMQLPQDQWSLRVAHYAPWLNYWWQTQKLFPPSSVVDHSLKILSRQDSELKATWKKHENIAPVRQQGVHESIHRDMMIAFGRWEFDPIQLTNPFPQNEGTVHLWQGDEDMLVPVTLQRYIAQQLPWIHYHELPGAGHLFPYAKGVSDAIVKTQLSYDS
ncbi:Acetyl-coenzyme A synthetase 2 [Bienertia sinuspersici]